MQSRYGPARRTGTWRSSAGTSRAKGDGSVLPARGMGVSSGKQALTGVAARTATTAGVSAPASAIGRLALRSIFLAKIKVLPAYLTDTIKYRSDRDQTQRVTRQGQEIPAPSQTSRANLLGLRQVLPGGFPGLRKWLRPHPASR